MSVKFQLKVHSIGSSDHFEWKAHYIPTVV